MRTIEQKLLQVKGCKALMLNGANQEAIPYATYPNPRLP